MGKWCDFILVCLVLHSEGKLKRMHTAVRLNSKIRSQSADAELVILNFPAPPQKLAAEENCILKTSNLLSSIFNYIYVVYLTGLMLLRQLFF